MERVNIAVLGLGTVGQGVIKILQGNREQWIKRCGSDIAVKKVLVKNINRPREVDLPLGVLTASWDEIISDDNIKIVVEVMGGIEPARTYILDAIRHGKNIITANKDLLAEHGQEIFEAADAAGIDLYFEASVAGGIPIITPLKQSLAANNIIQVMGIINGTTNFILTKMSKEGADYAEALRQAQELGYAEADPTADVGGLDAARKIAILASLAFHTRVRFQDVYVEGITRLTSKDLQNAKDLGYAIKLLGIAREENKEVEVRVHPVLIPDQHPLASVNDSFNAVFVRGDAVGETMFFGRGAGQLPTASSVVGDILEVISNINHGCNGRLRCTCYDHKVIKPIGEVSAKYYLRMQVLDKPGVLAGIAGVFGDHDVSLATVLQKNGSHTGAAELVLITHAVKEKHIQDALSVLKKMPITKSIENIIRVEGN